MKAYQFILAGLIGAAAVAGIGFLASRGSAARLEGAITNIRTLGSDETSSVAIVDFEVANPSQILLIVGDRDLLVVDEQGMQHESSTISAADLKMLFQYFPALAARGGSAVFDNSGGEARRIARRQCARWMATSTQLWSTAREDNSAGLKYSLQGAFQGLF